MTRTFINTAAICFTALLDVAFLGERLSALELSTFGTILIAIYLYSIPAPEHNRLKASRTAWVPALRGACASLALARGLRSVAPTSARSLTQRSLLTGARRKGDR